MKEGNWSEKSIRRRDVRSLRHQVAGRARPQATHRARLPAHPGPAAAARVRRKCRSRTISTARFSYWYSRLGPGTPVMRSHAYGLLRAILGTAVAEDLIAANHCRIRGAGQARTSQGKSGPRHWQSWKSSQKAMQDRLTADGAASRLVRAAVRGAGRATARRRDLAHGVLHVRRSVVRAGGQWIAALRNPRTGVRNVNIPPHLMPLVHDHLIEHAGREPGRAAVHRRWRAAT